ncbi:hypothetical protein COCHEDRAFT_1020852 [Bipolaris maydis C5]|uniref:Uncharacterized protein n=2 Tax=Cochliobolus heterostrophus TaxID=5016 RepID=M2UYY9_COCH5|nr:hypothetical protein COCHEDRAFT_1020852 [Bipolaris maydis C5]
MPDQAGIVASSHGRRAEKGAFPLSRDKTQERADEDHGRQLCSYLILQWRPASLIRWCGEN